MIADITRQGLQRGLSKAYSACDAKVSTFAAEALAAGSLARAGSTAVGHNITTALCIRPLTLAVR